jgi:hypothetical protein
MIPAATPAFAGTTLLSMSVDEVGERQSATLQTALFGDHGLLAPGRQSVAVHPFVGGYDEDGILSGVAVSWNARWNSPWVVGVNAGAMDLGIGTWTVGVSAGRDVWTRGGSSLLVQGAIAYQRMGGGGDTAAYSEPYDRDAFDHPVVLLESFTLGHAALHAVFTADLWVFRPVADIAWVGTTYRFDGDETAGPLLSDPMTPRDGRNQSSKMTFGLGAALDVERAILFGGLTVAGDYAVFQVNVGFVF